MTEIVDTSEFVVADIDDIEDVAPLPRQDYVATIRDVTVKKTERRSDGSIVTRANVIYHIDTDQYPPDYDVDNAPTGVKLSLPFGGMVVDCGDRAQPTKIGCAAWKRFLKQHGHTGGVAFVRRDDLDGDWSVAPDVLTDLIGKQVIVTIGHDKFEGELRPQIIKVRPVD